MIVEELVPAPAPGTCCERLEGLPFRVFLDSATGQAGAGRSPRLGRYSFVTADPVAVVRGKAARTEAFDLTGGGFGPQTPGIDGLTTLREWLSPFRTEARPDLPPFQGGAIGYVAYDWGRTLERLPEPRHDDLAVPDLVLAVYDWVLAWDHESSRAWLISSGLPGRNAPDRARRAAARARQVAGWLDEGPPASGGATAAVGPMRCVPRRAPLPSHPVSPRGWDPGLDLRSSFTRDGYLEAVARVREYIHAGDIFQANLSQRFEAPLRELPWALYRRLRVRNAAPFGAFLDLPDVAIVSASPERFLRVDAAGAVETRPIKGTRSRGFGPEHDAALGQALSESEKDRAENLMIVDLLRNDLSRVCAPGTVAVPELFALEHYATVHHLVSTVVGRLEAGTDALDLLRAAFPGGSITGAPKVRAMEIITELEQSERNVYCGAIGYWSTTGALDTSIAIRTAIVSGQRVYFSAGGGIVADSDPEDEYRETLHKARGLIEALEPSREG